MILEKYIITATREAIEFILRNDSKSRITFNPQVFNHLYVIETVFDKEFLEGIIGVEKVEYDSVGRLDV